MNIRFFLLFFCTAAVSLLVAQDAMPTLPAMASIKGQIATTESDVPKNSIAVTVFDDVQKRPIGQAFADENGEFTVLVSPAGRYRVEAVGKTLFKSDTIFPKVINEDYNVKLQLVRKPGYDFDITIFDRATTHLPINTLKGCKVEIYNNTSKVQELTIPELNRSTFGFSFAEGNHYTALVRKQGYLNRRIEIYVDVNGCILCIDGMGVNEPDVVPLMNHGNETGMFLGNIDLDSLYVGRVFEIPNLYYDFDKAFIRPDAAKVLDKLAVLLRDNPSITVELGSHTDARGSDEYNLGLSDRRAKSAVDYLVSKGGVDADKITWKGYGETALVNACSNGVTCDEVAHQDNRRTEIKIVGIEDESPLWNFGLQEIIEDPNLYRRVIKMEKEGQPMTGAYR